eukprot:10647_1
MAVSRNERYGLLTFAHGTFYGLQLLQREITIHFTSSGTILDSDTKMHKIDHEQNVTYSKISSTDPTADDEQDDTLPTKTKSREQCHWFILCSYCPRARPFAYAIIGLFQITPQAIIIFYGKNIKTLAIISLIPYLLNTIAATYYYFKFLYYFSYLKEYKFSLLDDIEFEYDDTDSVPLVLMSNDTDENKTEAGHESATTNQVNEKLHSASHSTNNESYAQTFFASLSKFMFLLLFFNIGIGMKTFVNVLFYGADNDVVSSIIFVVFSYPFIAANMCFIELQLMHELLNQTTLEETQYKLLSSNSSFWFLFGFVLNHYPMLYFMLKTSAFLWFYSLILYVLLDVEHQTTELYGYIDTGLFILYLVIYLYEPYFVKILLHGYYNLYPPIKNRNIHKLTPPDKACPTPFLERIKIILLAILEFLTPYSWIIECSLTIINSVFLLFYFVVWDKYISSNPQYDYAGAGLPFLLLSSVSIIVVIYAVSGEQCCYTLGTEYMCTQFLCCKRKKRCKYDCCCKCVQCCTCECLTCCTCADYFYCWFCCFGLCCCTPNIVTSPDYKFRFLTFMESLSLLLKLLHYYNYSTINNAWYDVGFMILIFLSLVTLFLLGLSGAFRSVHGLEIQSIMRSSSVFIACYLIGFGFIQIIVYGNFIFTMCFDISRINAISLDYQPMIFMIFIWITIYNLYTKEYRAFTKQIERDWFKLQEIQLIGFKRTRELPPMIGSLFHLLQLLIVSAATVCIYYIIQLAHIDTTNANWKFERGLCITNLIFSILMLIIAMVTTWSMSLAPADTLKQVRQKQVKKVPTMITRVPTVYRDL